MYLFNHLLLIDLLPFIGTDGGSNCMTLIMIKGKGKGPPITGHQGLRGRVEV
jgi:hypothetical protein